MNKSSKSNITASSLIDLKAELFRKQDQFKRDRLQTAGSSAPSGSKPSGSKKPSIWSKKNAGVKARAEKDLEHLAEERDQLDDARKKLEAKAKFYEKMTGDGYPPDADSSEIFLVDFEKKVYDQRSEMTAGVQGPVEKGQTRSDEREGERADTPPPADPGEEWVDYTDTLGRSRRCMRKDLPQLISMDKQLHPEAFEEKANEGEKKKEDLPDLLSSDMYREMLRKKWQEEEEEAAKRPPGPTHYQNVKYDEVRDMGVGYFDFSKDQTQRNEQMETLQLLRDETLDQRQRREKLKQKRKAAMAARLEKVKERKRQRGELVEDEKEEEEEKDEEEKKDLTTEKEEEVERTPKEKKVREWDIGKVPLSPWEQQMSNLRNDRPSEFAPPSCYGSGPKQFSQKSTFTPPKDYSSTYGNNKEKTGVKTIGATFPPPKDYSSTYGSSKETTGLKTSGATFPPPNDYSSMYGRMHEKTGFESTNKAFSQCDKASGSKDKTVPFISGGVSAPTNTGGTDQDAISSALLFFRQNMSNK